MSVEAAFEVGRLYAPIKAIADTLAASKEDVFIRLPALVGYYPMSALSGSGSATNHTGGGGDLVQTGTVPAAFDGNAYRQVGNGVNYLSVTSAYGITGTEAFVSSSIRGLTIGCWCMIDTVPGTNSGVAGKDDDTADRGYSIFYSTSGKFNFFVSGDGVSLVIAQGAGAGIGIWHFVVGRFMPSVEVAIFTDGDKNVNTTSVPSSCFVSSQAFEVGRYHGGDVFVLHAKVRDLFICAAALSDDLIEEIRNSSRP